MSENPIRRVVQWSDEFFIPILKMADTVGLGPALRRGTWQVSNSILNGVFKVLFKMDVTGRNYLIGTPNAVICTKYSSGIYPFIAWNVTQNASGRKLFQAFDNVYFETPALRSLLYYCDCISIHDGIMDEFSREFLKEKLAAGEHVGLTLNNVLRGPEGNKIVKNLEVIRIAREARVPIIPVVVPGVEDTLDFKIEQLSLNRKISVNVLEPFEDHLTSDDDGASFAKLQVFFEE
ncbi:MAG: hypothetical protein ACTSUE_25775 [Promethearchaeota archaeon]